MLLPDVNVLIYAHREDAHRHGEYLGWLTSVAQAAEAFALSDLVLSAFLRIVTHQRIYRPPSDLDTALGFVGAVRARDNAVLVSPGPRHWPIFTGLCRGAAARGNLIPDAYLAALAIEHGCTFVTTDRGYARFPGLRWRHPLDG